MTFQNTSRHIFNYAIDMPLITLLLHNYNTIPLGCFFFRFFFSSNIPRNEEKHRSKEIHFAATTSKSRILGGDMPPPMRLFVERCGVFVEEYLKIY